MNLFDRKLFSSFLKSSTTIPASLTLEEGLHAQLRNSMAKALEEQHILDSLPSPVSSQELKERIERALDNLSSIGNNSVAGFTRLLKHRLVTFRAYRRFQIRANARHRDAKTPEPFNTLMIMQIGLWGEALFSAFLMVGDGKLDVGPALGYGFAISLLNVSSAFAAGFFGGKGSVYRLGSPKPMQGDDAIRRWSRRALGVYAAAFCTLHFVSARVNALGSHHGKFDPEKAEYGGLFNFSDLGLFETFNNAGSIWLIFLGVLASLLGFYKGLTGISDTIWGFSAAKKECGEKIEDARLQIEESSLNQLDDTLDEAIADAEELHEEAHAMRQDIGDQRSSAVETLTTHNNGVLTAKDRLRAEALHREDDDAFVYQGKCHTYENRSPNIDLNQFDQYLLPTLVPRKTSEDENVFDLADAIARLNREYTKQKARIETANAEFMDGGPEFIAPQNEGDNDESFPTEPNDEGPDKPTANGAASKPAATQKNVIANGQGIASRRRTLNFG